MGDPERAWNDPKWLQMMLTQWGDQRTRYYDALKTIAAYAQQCPTTDSLHMAMIAREALTEAATIKPKGDHMTNPTQGAFRLIEPEPVVFVCPKHGEFYRGKCMPIKCPVTCPKCAAP